MEPKLGDTSRQNLNLPHEPSLHKTASEDKLPRIIPGELKNPHLSGPLASPNAEEKTLPPANGGTAGSSPLPKDPKALMAALSKDVSELSVPLKKTEEETRKKNTQPNPLDHFGVKGSDGVILPPEDDLGDPMDPSTSSGIFRSIMLFICLCFVIVAAWQVTLFLQPDFLKKEPLKTVSQVSCDYFYCPPVRTPVILTNQVNAISPGHWELKISVQNQDMRTQKLPVIQLTLENASKSKTQKIFEPSEYTTSPNVTSFSGGETLNITVPFTFDEGRPTSYRVKVLEN